MADVTPPEEPDNVRRIEEASGQRRAPRTRAANPALPQRDQEGQPDRQVRDTRPGRPLKLSPQVTDAFVATLRTGVPIKDACAVVGISVSTVDRWRAVGEEALGAALAQLQLEPDDDYDADELLAAVPEDRRAFVDFLWRFTTADSIGVAELAARVQRTKDDRVALQLLRLRRPDQYREQVTIDAHLVIHESEVRGKITERLDRLGAIETSATAEDEPEAPEPTGKARKAARARKQPAKAAARKQGALR